MTVLAVIPARWQSTRFPGKPLAQIAGREMIARVWDQVVMTPSVDRTVVATDSDKIAAFCQENGMDVVMTRSDHPTGSDRLAEVAEKITADIYVNVQGDEPLIEPASIDAVSKCLLAAVKRGIGVATGYITAASDDQMDNPSVVHLVPALDGTVITFSRFPVPYPQGEAMQRTVHVGLYAFTGDALAKYSAWEQGPVEKSESIEILRFLEHGERVACVRVPPGSIGVDTPDDVILVEAVLAERGTL